MLIIGKKVDVVKRPDGGKAISICTPPIMISTVTASPAYLPTAGLKFHNPKISSDGMSLLNVSVTVGGVPDPTNVKIPLNPEDLDWTLIGYLPIKSRGTHYFPKSYRDLFGDYEWVRIKKMSGFDVSILGYTVG